MNKFFQDAALTETKAFPAANANNNTDGIFVDTQEESIPGAELIVRFPENSILVATKSISVKVQTSSDNGDADSYSDLSTLGTVTVTGKAGNGLPDSSGNGFEVDANGDVIVAYPLPRNLEAYLRVNVAVEDAGGDLTGLSYSAGIVG